ncbi:MAG TPA: ABC transporter substrate-binding protein [Pyrinomonadaceae bacterium]|nr:ABC transporter substrate-binding protein [Pyrinomonadaceae bacterium]
MSHDHDDCQGHGLSRRSFLLMSSRLSLLAGAAALGASPLLSACRTTREEPALKIGYLPITDATPLLIGHSQGFFEQEGLRVEQPVLMRGWPEVAEGFLAGNFNLVHLLIPIPIYMRYAQRHPVKVVAWNHMNGSGLTVGVKSGIKRVEDIAGKQIAVPHWYSMHNIILQLCMRKYGIEAVVQDRNAPLRPNQTNLFVMKPPDMPTAMSSGSIDGYIVAEPFNAAGEVLAQGSIVRFTGDVFKNHPCCVAVMNERDIQEHPEWAQKVMNGLVRAQHWTIGNRDQVSQILSKDGKGYLPMPEPVIKRAMSKYDLESYGLQGGTGAIRHPEWGVSRIGFQPYPYESTTREIVNLLKQTKVEGQADFLQGLDPEQVARELFDYALVKNAADRVGGLRVFEGVDPDNPYVRAEMIEV